MREGVRKLQGYDVEKFSSNTINPQPDISEEQVSRIEDLYVSVVTSLNTKDPETETWPHGWGRLGLLDPTQTLPV